MKGMKDVKAMTRTGIVLFSVALVAAGAPAQAQTAPPQQTPAVQGPAPVATVKVVMTNQDGAVMAQGSAVIELPPAL